MMNSLRHIGIVTKNIDSSIDFYKRFFKFQIIVDQIEKGDFIESYEYDGEILNGVAKNVPGTGKIPQAQLMTTFLLIS